LIAVGECDRLILWVATKSEWLNVLYDKANFLCGLSDHDSFDTFTFLGSAPG
jgi:hypothetical protein